MKIAVLADLHLPDDPPLMHEDVLRQSLQICRDTRADLVILAGDMAKAGAIRAGDRMIREMKNLPCPAIITRGNTEEEIPGFEEKISFAGVYQSKDVEVFSLETLPDAPPPSGKFRILAAHRPMEAPAGVDLVICGHKHRDIRENKLEAVRGLDPDKVLGGPPAVAFFEIQNNRVCRTEAVLPGFSIDDWSREEKETLFRQIGVAVKVNAAEELRRAEELNVPKVEILHKLSEAKIPAEHYLQTTKGEISIHLPDISFENPDKAAEIVRWGTDLGATRFTAHVPQASLREMLDEKNFNRMADLYAKTFAAAPQAVFGIENMHMRDGETEFERRFGYTPPEQLQMIRAVRARLPEQKIGAVLDIGHARNNDVFYPRYSLSQWYEMLKGEIVTMHLHQVSDADGVKNHTPITGWYQRLISLASFIKERRSGNFAEAALFVECRGGWESTYQMFRKELQG